VAGLPDCVELSAVLPGFISLTTPMVFTGPDTWDDFAHAVTTCDRSLKLKNGFFMRKVSRSDCCD
jgi:hypothetical protein